MQARQEGYCGQRGVRVEIYLLVTRQQDGDEWRPPSKVCVRVGEYLCEWVRVCACFVHICIAERRHSTFSLYVGRCDDFGCACACVCA